MPGAEVGGRGPKADVKERSVGKMDRGVVLGRKVVCGLVGRNPESAPKLKPTDGLKRVFTVEAGERKELMPAGLELELKGVEPGRKPLDPKELEEIWEELKVRPPGAGLVRPGMGSEAMELARAVDAVNAGLPVEGMLLKLFVDPGLLVLSMLVPKAKLPKEGVPDPRLAVFALKNVGDDVGWPAFWLAVLLVKNVVGDVVVGLKP